MVTVAAAQLACAPGDLATNLERHLALIESARERGVELLVFPELSLTDYASEPDAAHLARDADAPELRALARAAGDLTVIAGFIEANPRGRPFNACAVLSGGHVVGVHRKLNLPTYGGLNEGRHYAAGDALTFAPTPLGPTALLVCADLWNPALPWLAALGGAEVMAVPAASSRGAVAPGFDSRDNWRLTLRHAAMTYGVPVVMANHCGARGGLDFWGGSMIVDAHGRVVAEAGAEPDLLVAVIDPEDGRRARAQLPTMCDAAPALVRDVLDALLAGGRTSG